MKHLTLAAVLSLTCASAFAGQSCTDAPKNTWMSKEQITTQVKGMGYTIKKLDCGRQLLRSERPGQGRQES